MTAVAIDVPYALDRALWIPVIAQERWDVRAAYELLSVIDDALFGDMPSEDSDDAE